VRDRVYLAWLVIFLAGLLSFSLPAFALEIEGLGVGKKEGYLVCYWKLQDIPFAELDEALRHGIPLEIHFQVRLLEIRALRRDREVLRYDTVREIFFDPVKKLYFVNFLGLPKLPEQAMSLEEAFEIAGNVDSLPLLPINRLTTDRTYRLKVRALLVQKVSPGLPSRVLRFIFRSGKIESKWVSIRFEL
jgi:hypothetical protein